MRYLPQILAVFGVVFWAGLVIAQLIPWYEGVLGWASSLIVLSGKYHIRARYRGAAAGSMLALLVLVAARLGLPERPIAQDALQVLVSAPLFLAVMPESQFLQSMLLLAWYVLVGLSCGWLWETPRYRMPKTAALAVAVAVFHGITKAEISERIAGAASVIRHMFLEYF